MICRYWVQRFGFPSDCEVVPWTGDNPSVVVGLGLGVPRAMSPDAPEGMHGGSGGCHAAATTAVVSLGTSDTLLLLLPEDFEFGEQTARAFRKVLPFGHIFPHALYPDRYFLMFCYTNGDCCRKQYLLPGEDWNQFEERVSKVEAGCGGRLGSHITVWIGVEPCS